MLASYLTWGLPPRVLTRLDIDDLPNLARVKLLSRDRAILTRPDGDHPAILPDRVGVLAVGDWVIAPFDNDPPVVQRRIDRDTVLRRRDPDGHPKDIAANVDVAYVCLPADAERHPRRLERWLAITADAEIDTVVVITKADPGVDTQDLAAALVPIAHRVPIVAVSAVHGTGVDALRDGLRGGRTGVLLGASGAGKSTLLNRLVGADVQPTGDVREKDGRGRHTTSARTLFRLGGGWLIDGPGVRSIGPLGEDGVAAAFPEVEAIAATCRFRDCGHDGEPGCAIDAALTDGRLDPARVAAWEKLGREVAYENRKADPQLARNAKAGWKRIHMENRRRRQFEDGP